MSNMRRITVALLALFTAACGLERALVGESAPLSMYAADTTPEEAAPEIPVVVGLEDTGEGLPARGDFPAYPRAFHEFDQWLRLALDNRTEDTVIVHWDRSALVDSRGKPHRISFNQPFVEPATSIPARSTRYLVVCPADHVSKFRGAPSCEDWMLKYLRKEAPLSFVLALEIEGREVAQTYRFKFKLGEVKW